VDEPTQAPVADITLAAAALPVVSTVDPALGGDVATPDGALTIQVPPGAAEDILTLSVMAVDPSASTANLVINGQYYVLLATDANGNAITTFDEPLTLVLQMPPDVDPNTIRIAIIDQSTSAYLPLDLQIQDDGAIVATTATLQI